MQLVHGRDRCFLAVKGNFLAMKWRFGMSVPEKHCTSDRQMTLYSKVIQTDFYVCNTRAIPKKVGWVSPISAMIKALAPSGMCLIWVPGPEVWNLGCHLQNPQPRWEVFDRDNSGGMSLAELSSASAPWLGACGWTVSRNLGPNHSRFQRWGKTLTWSLLKWMI